MITTGKRTTLQAQHTATVSRWAKHFQIDPPIIKVHSRPGRPNTATYRRRKKTIYIPPTAESWVLIHEFAHHLAYHTGLGRNHGPGYRIALVQIATLACGQAKRYPWEKEYRNIKTWACKHSLTERTKP